MCFMYSGKNGSHIPQVISSATTELLPTMKQWWRRRCGEVTLLTQAQIAEDGMFHCDNVAMEHLERELLRRLAIGYNNSAKTKASGLPHCFGRYASAFRLPAAWTRLTWPCRRKDVLRLSASAFVNKAFALNQRLLLQRMMLFCQQNIAQYSAYGGTNPSPLGRISLRTMPFIRQEYTLPKSVHTIRVEYAQNMY